MIWVSEAMEVWEQDIELGVGCGHQHHSWLQHTKYGIGNLLENGWVQMLNTVLDSVLRECSHLQDYYTYVIMEKCVIDTLRNNSFYLTLHWL